jgi:predicted HicB family RNase H-like nuclease
VSQDGWFTLRVPPALHARLKEMASREYRSMSSQVTKYVEEGLARDEKVHGIEVKKDGQGGI